MTVAQKKIKSLLAKQSQSALAKLVGLTQPTISCLVSGKYATVKKSTLRKFEALGIRPGDWAR